jgi:lambda repressor-like predicted transcriptional regulator
MPRPQALVLAKHRAGLTIRELANRVDRTYSTVRDVLAGKYSNEPVGRLIAEELGVPFESIFMPIDLDVAEAEAAAGDHHKTASAA